jgi:hypothetical protein
MTNPAVIPPPVSAPERASTRNPKLNARAHGHRAPALGRRLARYAPPRQRQHSRFVEDSCASAAHPIGQRIVPEQPDGKIFLAPPKSCPRRRRFRQTAPLAPPEHRLRPMSSRRRQPSACRRRPASTRNGVGQRGLERVSLRRLRLGSRAAPATAVLGIVLGSNLRRAQRCSTSAFALRSRWGSGNTGGGAGARPTARQQCRPPPPTVGGGSGIAGSGLAARAPASAQPLDAGAPWPRPQRRQRRPTPAR